MELNYHSIEALLNAAKENNCRLSQLVLTQQAEQMELPEQEIYEKCGRIIRLWHPASSQEAPRT